LRDADYSRKISRLVRPRTRNESMNSLGFPRRLYFRN
jgi:hypothetical protein